jgi:hypothetical protein
MTEDRDPEGVDGEATPVGEPLAETVTVTLTDFEVRVLQVILQHLIAGQSIDPCVLDDVAMVHLQRTLNLELRRGED